MGERPQLAPLRRRATLSPHITPFSWVGRSRRDVAAPNWRPDDALRCFLSTGVDYLALHDVLVSKTAIHKYVAPLIQTFGDVSMIVHGAMEAG